MLKTLIVNKSMYLINYIENLNNLNRSKSDCNTAFIKNITTKLQGSLENLWNYIQDNY